MAKSTKNKKSAPAKGRRRKDVILDKVVSFRVSPERSSELREIVKDNAVMGCKSSSDFARKLVADFLTGRLVYKNPKDKLKDFDKYPKPI